MKIANKSMMIMASVNCVNIAEHTHASLLRPS